jgi:hypothetical protein
MLPLQNAFGVEAWNRNPRPIIVQRREPEGSEGSAKSLLGRPRAGLGQGDNRARNLSRKQLNFGLSSREIAELMRIGLQIVPSLRLTSGTPTHPHFLG